MLHVWARARQRVGEFVWARKYVIFTDGSFIWIECSLVFFLLFKIFFFHILHPLSAGFKASILTVVDEKQKKNQYQSLFRIEFVFIMLFDFLLFLHFVKYCPQLILIQRLLSYMHMYSVYWISVWIVCCYLFFIDVVGHRVCDSVFYFVYTANENKTKKHFVRYNTASIVNTYTSWLKLNNKYSSYLIKFNVTY